MVFFNLKKKDVDLTKDILNVNFENPNKFWKHIIKYLKSDESSTRFFALTYIIRNEDNISTVLYDQNIAASLFKAIYSISTADETEMLRYLATYLLPLCNKYQVTDQFKELVFQKVLKEFLRIYPKDLTNPESVKEFINEISGPEIKHLRYYVYYLRNLSHLFHFPQANHPSFQSYVDRLFAILLNQNINIYIQAEVFHDISMNYTVTNGNRLRFEKFLRKPLIDLGVNIINLSTLYSDDDSLDEYSERNISTPKVALPKMPSDIKYWKSKYYCVWKVWYLRPTDNDILLNDCSQMKTAGYALKRKEQLFKYVRQNNDGSLEAKLEVELPYRLNTQPSLEYFISKMEDNGFYLNRKSKKKSFIKENDNEKIANNMLAEISDSLKKKNEYLIFKPVPLQLNEIYLLEIEIDNKTIVFDQFPFMKKFYLKNKSFNKVKFQFQVYPFESFIVEPSYGEILPKKKIQIKIKYVYHNKTFNSSSNINGFLRLRNIRGYPIERISLIGISLPSIKINARELDFGIVPPNTKRINFFVIKNLKRELNICNIFILEKKYSTVFSISEKQVMIENISQKIITITLNAQNLGNINCKCVVTTNKGETYFIKLKAICGYAITSDKRINFGPTDIYYNNASKRITIENKDPIYPISIPLIPSTNEIVINNNDQVIIQPKEKKQIKIDFNSMITGTRNEFISINNPITEVKEIDVNALSGPIILIPIYDEIGFPITFPFTEVSIKIPLINVIDEKAKCLITLPKNTPFNISLADENTSILPHNNNNSTVKDLYFEIKERSTVFIKVTYCGWTQGLYRTNLSFELDSPYKLHLYNICLTACCVAKSKKSYDKEKLTRIRNFFNNKFDSPAFKGTEPENIESMYKDNKSKTLVLPSQFSVISKLIYSDDNDDSIQDEKFKKLFENNENVSNDKENMDKLKSSGIRVVYKKNANIDIPEYYENDEEYGDYSEEEYDNSKIFSSKLYNNILILRNKSDVDQNYHIFISGPFFTNVPLDGVIKNYSYLFIPIYIDYKKFSNLITKENYYFTCYGHISIMDECGYFLGSVHTLLQGLNNTMIDYEVGKVAYSPTTIEFPKCEQYQKVKKVIYLRNKTNYELEYSIELNNYEKKIYKNQNDVNDQLSNSVNESVNDNKLDETNYNLNENDENNNNDMTNNDINNDLNNNSEIDDYINSEINNNENDYGDNGFKNIDNDENGEEIFRIDESKISKIIKPFEIIPLEITCLSFSMGSFKAVLKINYNSPNIFKNLTITDNKEDDEYASFYKETSNRDLLDIQFKAPNIIFSVTVGKSEIDVSDNLLYFGDIIIGNSCNKDLMLSNKGIPVNFNFFSISPYHLEENLIFLRSKRKETNIVSFKGKKTGIFNSYLILRYDNILDFIPLSAFCGKMKIKTNIGELIKNYNIEKDNFWEHSDLALDYNCIEFSKSKSLEFIIYNKGTIDISLADIISSNEDILTWHIKEDKNDNNNILFNSKLLLSDNYIINKSEYYNKMEVDWDEISYAMERQNITSNRLIKSKENDKSSFPIMILPNESVRLILTAWGHKEGKFKETLDFFINIGNNREIYTLYLKGDISHPLSLKTKNVEFGVVQVNKTSDIEQISFTNDSNRVVKWWIEFVETKYNILNAQKRKEDNEAFSNIIHPFSIFPEKGEIGAKKSQNVEIKFIPNIAQCDIETKVTLRTNIFDRLPFRLHGVGGSVILKATVTNVDFGCCAVGSREVVPISIVNEGLIYSKFSTECTSPCFKADPEFGTIKNGESFIIRLSYVPSVSDQIDKGYFKLIPENSSNNKIIYISLNGMSGYPDIEISRTLVDFGYTVLRGKNVKSLVIRNKGKVPGILNFSSKHPSLSIEEVDETDCIVVEPKTKKRVHIIYLPMKMEILNTFGVFSNIKFKSESILVNFKAIVCQPKLVIDPPDFYDTIDFGVCHVNKPYEKEITISNEGTIDLKYSIFFDFEGSPDYYNSNELDDSDDTDDFDDDKNNSDDKENDNNEESIKMSDSDINIKSLDKIDSDNEKCPFNFSNNSDVLPVGKKSKVILKFLPLENKKYEYSFSLYYGFQPICGSVSGIGGIGKINFFPKVDFINFGLCRINQETLKKIYIKNTGNISERYVIRPIIQDFPLRELYKKEIDELNEFEQSEYIEPKPSSSKSNKNNKEIEKTNTPQKNLLQWEKYLESVGLKMLNHEGVCKPNEEKTIDFIYNPILNTPLNLSFKLYTKWKEQEIHIVGKYGTSSLKVYDFNDKELTSKRGIKFGMRSVNTINKLHIKLKNTGDFGIDFMVNKSIKKIFEVYPESGFIPPNSSFVLSISYFPKEESVFKWKLNILWTNGIIIIPVSGKSGTGKVNITFPDIYEDGSTVTKENVNESNCYLMNYNPIPLHSYSIKKFYMYNSGIVGVDIGFQVTGEDFSIAFTSELLEYSVNSMGGVVIDYKNTPAIKKPEWNKKLEINIPAHHYIEIGCRYYADTEFLVKERIYINSNCFYGRINLNARGGTVVLNHTGDLLFNDINAKYSYSKNITLTNTGTIDTKVSFKWTMSSHKHYKIITPGKIYFKTSYDNDDPRSEIMKNYIIGKNKITSNSKEIQMSLLDENKKYTNYKKNSKFYWELLRMNILPKYFDYDSIRLLSYIEHFENNKAFSNFINSFKVTIDLIGKHRFKRKKNLYKLVESTPVTSQSLSNVQSYMRVFPEEIILQANQSANIHVDLNLEHETDYIATLHCISNFSVIDEHLISLVANPKQISVLCDMNKIDFRTQAIGETEIITKEFKNVGSKDISYTINSNNEGLRIIPDEGKLMRGESVVVKFIFQPITDHIQSFPILFQPECSQPIRLQFFGAGGIAQMSLKNGSTYEFGNCVIGKKIDVYLPIENKGTALLKINGVILYSNGTFTEGPDWPNERFCIEPKTTYRLPLIFKPETELPPPATVSIITPLENYEVNLSGVGKDAMIIISSLYLEYNDCIIGNQYEQKVTFRNTGDVNYPIKMELNDIIPGIKFFPDKFTISPYSTFDVAIQFKPTIEINKDIFVDVNSPYSKNQIRLKLHSGHVKLLIEKSVFNFGMFETATVPKIKFDLKNVGSISTHYSIVNRNNYSNIQFTNKSGFIKSNESTTIVMSYVNTNKHHGIFSEIFDIKSDLINSSLSFKVIGDCNHALIHPQEISTVDLGLCPIFEHTKKSIVLKNYGKFPLTFKIKVVYPIQCNVTKGVLNGNESQVIKFSWMPTGGYLFHSTATLSSNAGNYSISITGRGTLPKINLSTEKLDYGICALNCSYDKTLTISNVGLVKFKWSIQQQNQDFILSENEGELQINESVDIKIYFTPKSLKCYQTVLYLECKGLTSREIQLVGIGGNMKFYVSPRIVDMGVCPKGVLTTGSFTIKSKGEVTVYSNFSEGKRINPNNVLMTPKSVVLLPGTSNVCKFDIIPYDEGPFEFRLIISTKEKTYKLKIIGTSKTLSFNNSVVDILKETKTLITMDPLKSYEYVHLDLFDIQISCLSKKLYDDKKIFNIIEDKVNEIKYLMTGNKEYLKKSSNYQKEHPSKIKFKAVGKKRFSVFKTPIVVANVPEFKQKSSTLKFKNHSIIEELDEEEDKNDKSLNILKEKLFKNENNDDKPVSKENLNIFTDDVISKSNILLNNLSNIDINNNNSNDNSSNKCSNDNNDINLEMKRCSSDGILILNNSPYYDSKKSSLELKNKTAHLSLLKLNKDFIPSDIITDEKNDTSDYSMGYAKDDEELLINRKDMILNKLLNDYRHINGLKENGYQENYEPNNLYLTRSKSIRSSITSFKDRLLNKQLGNIEEKKEFIDKIKKEFIDYKINKNESITKNSLESNEKDSIIKSIIDYSIPKVNNNNINNITNYVVFENDDDIEEILSRPPPFKSDNNDKNKLNVKFVDFIQEKEEKKKKKNHRNLQFRTIDHQYKKIYQNNTLIYIPKK